MNNKSNHHNVFASKNNWISGIKYFYFIVKFSPLKHGRSLNFCGMDYKNNRESANSFSSSELCLQLYISSLQCSPVTFTVFLTNWIASAWTDDTTPREGLIRPGQTRAEHSFGLFILLTVIWVLCLHIYLSIHAWGLGGQRRIQVVSYSMGAETETRSSVRTASTLPYRWVISSLQFSFY